MKLCAMCARDISDVPKPQMVHKPTLNRDVEVCDVCHVLCAILDELKAITTEIRYGNSQQPKS